MVGPCPSEWKVLRETDGERFVPLTKGFGFQGHFAECGDENRCNEIYSTIKNSLYVI